ncbi:hypothetical protein [Staphylothermus hellenicus]|uniref:Uncharacterized protein n=1 Tax=Staphylothermus hellenicus (strain DSM 12710 / JCM 10830 / BK20S6-10-b1 / P8) TaxID=591019 RepID=D7DCB7_STAHD|nr:hypothetical protein [Staphylothermus hellenicus]ADI31814.1 hypothetical protein Shell_0693 [Staphylothermus hellenicus DSM 12710]
MYCEYRSVKPSYAFILGLVAGVLLIMMGTMILVATLLARPFSVRIAGPVEEIRSEYASLWFLIDGFLILIFSLRIYSGDPSKVHEGGILITIFSVFSMFWFTILLGVIGGMLALIWKPQKTQPLPSSFEEKQSI